MNEFNIIEWIREQGGNTGFIQTGPGDDCAQITMSGHDLVTSIDAISENTHFSKGEDPYRIGWKGGGASLSDIAAAGCTPIGIIAALQIEKGRGAEYIKKIFKGLSAVCSRFDISVAGGDLSTLKKGLTLSVTSLGVVHENGMLVRSGAGPGDAVFVSGTVGGSFAGRHLTFIPRIQEASVIRELVEPTSMIDISDGLYSELRHISTESGVGIRVDPGSIPVSDTVSKKYSDMREAIIHALTDGEDFELLFTIKKDDVKKLMDNWHMGTQLTCIGYCTDAYQKVMLEAEEFDIDTEILEGYEHEF